MWKPPDAYFVVMPLVMPWPTVSPRNDPEKKKLFGIALAHGLKPFEAGLKVFGSDTGSALWASQEWIADPDVVQARSEQAVKQPSKLLDKDQLAVRVLDFADERDLSGQFHINEGKDRLAAFKLYAEIMQFIGKTDTVTNNNFTNNVMKIELVAPEEKQQEQIQTIEHEDAEILDLPSVQLVS